MTPDAMVAFVSRQTEGCFRSHQFQIAELSIQLKAETSSNGVNRQTIVRVERTARADLNPMLDVPRDMEISTVEIRENKPRLILGLQYQRYGDVDANLELGTETRHRIDLDQHAITTRRRDRNKTLAFITELAAGIHMTTAGKCCLTLHTCGPVSHTRNDGSRR